MFDFFYTNRYFNVSLIQFDCTILKTFKFLYAHAAQCILGIWDLEHSKEHEISTRNDTNCVLTLNKSEICRNVFNFLFFNVFFRSCDSCTCVTLLGAETQPSHWQAVFHCDLRFSQTFWPKTPRWTLEDTELWQSVHQPEQHRRLSLARKARQVEQSQITC